MTVLLPREFARRTRQRGDGRRWLLLGGLVVLAVFLTALTAVAGPIFLVLAITGLVPATAVLWWTWHASPFRVFTASHQWRIEAGDVVEVCDGELCTQIPWRDIVRAHRIGWDQLDQAGDIEGHLWLHLHEGVSVQVSDRADGFERAWQRIRNRVPSTSESVGVLSDDGP